MDDFGREDETSLSEDDTLAGDSEFEGEDMDDDSEDTEE